MTIATITIAVLAFVIIAQRVRAACLEDLLVRQDRQLVELSRLCDEALHQRDEERLAHKHLNERVGAYLREATILAEVNEALKDGTWTDDDGVVADVEAWLQL